MAKVSVIIPGRCEQYFQQTIDSCLEKARGEIEVIAIVDGYKPSPPLIAKDERVKIIQLDKSIGQRASYNLGVKKSTGKYLLKIDAHALMSEGFDVVLQKNCGEKTVVLPEMRRLNVYTWEHKPRGKTHFMFFGIDLYCHFWREYRKREVAQCEYPEVMTGQGSCWFTSRKWNDYIGLLDEKVGSWGNVGIEVSLRTWLCGGNQIVNKKAWQAHWFRRDEGGFTYPMDGRDVAKAHKYTWNNYYFKDNAFKNQSRPFKWLIDKFSPVPGWETYMKDEYKAPRVIVYYTDSKLNPLLANAVRKRLKKVAGPIPIISVSQEPLAFGKNICVGKKPYTYKSMYEQFLAGVKAAPDESIIYLCEHDVFYHPSHFAFLPPKKDTMYFNTNRYYYSLGMDNFFRARGNRALSQGVAYKEYIQKHAEDRLVQAGENITEKMQIKYENWKSERPNVDIRHGDNLTPNGKWKREYMNGKKRGKENLPGWGRPKHFQSITGYKEEKKDIEIDPKKYLHNKYNKKYNQISPVRIPNFKRKNLAELFNQFGYKKGAEIGVKKGKFSECLCESITNIKLICVDIWEEYSEKGLRKIDSIKAENLYEEAKARLEKYNVTFIREKSMDAIRLIKENSLDFVYLDANHTFDYIMQDLIEWNKKVRIGGIIAGHDYFRFRNAGVVPAVDTYTNAHNIYEWFITDEKEPSFFWVKEGNS